MGYYIQTSLTGLAILALIYFYMDWRRKPSDAPQNYFLGILLVTALLQVFELGLNVFKGQPVIGGRALMLFIVCIFYLLNPVPVALWTLFIRSYAELHSGRRALHNPRVERLILLPLVVNTVLALASLFGDYMYVIDANNEYQRGPLFFLLSIIDYGYLIVSVIMVLLRKNRIRKREFIAFLLFAVPPVICGTLQFLFFGLSVLWLGMSFSILIVYLYIQNKTLLTDHLTGLGNRWQFDRYLEAYQANPHVKYRLGGFMIDLDGFKQINDVYGHDQGDHALEEAADVLRRSLRKEDLVVRFGGDEFAVLAQVHQGADLQMIARRIQDNLDQFNEKRLYPFMLEFSIGYDLFDPKADLIIQDFVRRIDEKMYAAKTGKRLVASDEPYETAPLAKRR